MLGSHDTEDSVLNRTDALILVVDDNADNRDVLARRVKRLGYPNVQMAEDGEAALKLIGEQTFDLVLLDVMMPGISGVDVLEDMRSHGRLEDTPVIMISAATEIDTVAKCLELGAEDYLPKPFNPIVLRARVNSVLEKKLLRAEVRRQLARLEKELAQAREQQLSMLPSEFPQASAARPVDVHAVLHPAQEVGGDLYDVFEVGPDTLCVAVGDVSGKGVPAALFMARTRSLLRAGALQFFEGAGRAPRPSELAKILNEELCKNNPATMFVTLFLGFLDLRSGKLVYLNAGHIPPFLLRGGTAAVCPSPPDLPLGAMDMVDHVDAELELVEGDALVVVSDGVLDIENAAGEDYTLERVLADLNELSAAAPSTITAQMLSRAHGFANGVPQFDDVTILALRLRGLKA